MEQEQLLFENSINGHIKSFSEETAKHLGKEWKEISKDDIPVAEEVVEFVKVKAKAVKSSKATKQVSIIDSEPALVGVSDIQTVEL